MNQFMSEVRENLPELEIIEHEPMAKHTTFRIGGPADYFCSPAMEVLADVLKLAKKHSIPVTVIGNGSNLLVGDKGVRGLVIEIGKNMSEIELSGHKIVAQAGALLSKVANTALSNSLSGMECLAGIPGSIGGAVVMNAGAYGKEMKDVLESVRVLTSDNEMKELTVDELELSYRHSIIPQENYIVLEATLILAEGDKDAIKAKMDELKEQRVTKQPLNYPSAGSTFKRPEGYFAGKLIMDAGLRGYTVGGAQVSEKHCGFVINAGNATASDVRQLMSDVNEKVTAQFGVGLEPEVKMIGEF